MASFTQLYDATLEGIGQDPDAKGSTFANQDKLPTLPLPELAHTFMRLRESLLPLNEATPEALAQYDALAADAVAKLGAAQGKLVQKHQSSDNYLVPWWEDYAYLSQRDPIPCSTNVFGIREGDFDPKTGKPTPPIADCIGRAALVMLETLAFNRMVAHEALPAEATRVGPICMDQYRKYISLRKPGLVKDEIVTTPSAESDSFHVMHRGAHFLVQALPLGAANTPTGKAAAETALNLAELRACLQEGVRQLEDSGAHPKDANECIGALTAGNRTNWAEAWAELEKASPQNKQNLESIMRCMTGLALDDCTDINSLKEASEQVMFRNPYNRWYDRNSVKVISKNGVVFDNGDHTPMDAVVLAYIPFEVLPTASMHVWRSGGFTGDEHQKVRDGFNPKDFVKVLHWTIPQSVKDRVTAALESHAAVCGPSGVNVPPGMFKSFTAPSLEVYSQVNVYKYHGLGRASFKLAQLPGSKKRGVNGDALVQQVLQLAFYLDRGRLTPGYESAATRGFKLGRTDTIRPFTQEQKEFVCAAAGDWNATQDELRVLLAKTLNKHLEVAARASNGQGTERHLFALKIAQQTLIGEPLPDIFNPEKSPLVAAAGNYCLLTSQMPGAMFVGGFGHIWGDGYGCCYYLRKKEVAIMVSCHAKAGLTNLERFEGNLTKAFNIVKGILAIEESTAKL